MSRIAFRPTLAGLFFGAIAVITMFVGGLFVVLWEASRRSMLESADAVQAATARRVEGKVVDGLAQVDRALRNVDLALATGLADPSDSLSLEPLLVSQLIDNPTLSAITFTHAEAEGLDAAGNPRLTSGARWQLSARRKPRDGEDAIETRRSTLEDGRFVVAVGDRTVRAGLLTTPLAPRGTVPDPTEQETFREAIASAHDVVRSDLRYAEPDDRDASAVRPPVVVTAAKVVSDSAQRFVGVVSVALRARAVDEALHAAARPEVPGDPMLIFLCDAHGRLVTRLSPTDPFVTANDTVRVVPTTVPPAVALALENPLLRTVSTGAERSFSVRVEGERYLVTFHELAKSRHWIVGIVVPEDFYVHELRILRNRFLVAYLVVSVLILSGGMLTLRAVRRGLGSVLEATTRMRQFDFSPSLSQTSFRDIQQVTDGLERAKTVTRALGKYVPLGLVRELYENNREPVLGGALREATVLFSDIRGFTEIAERLSPAEVARALGCYFDRMTRAIETTHGIVDKFIGDSVMALWNAPGPCPGHPSAACRAALACVRETEALYASPDWRGLPPLVTRFGIHVDNVFVGHFGAPSRLSYTALGDGVNLASRLEELCKQYGVVTLVSDAVEERARGEIAFRLVDRVVVKGKTTAVTVYEILGARGEPRTNDPAARAYERAFEAYTRRAFREARDLLQSCGHDGPSRVLAERCARYIERPPPPEWDGVFHADHK